MTTLIAQRQRHRTGRAAALTAPTPTVAQEPELILWRSEGDGLWRGELDLLDAGTIRRTPVGYEVTGWDGSPEGVHATLEAAQRSLEPAHRARLREQERRDGAPVSIAVAVALLTGLTIATSAGLLTAFVL